MGEGQVLLQRMKDVAKGIHTCASYLYSTIGRLHTEYLCFHKAISKLHYVTLRIYRTLLTKGICSAEEKDGEDGEGDGEGSGNVDGMTFEDDVEGTGMGEGEGKQDVSDEIENEEQLLGLQGEENSEDEGIDGYEAPNPLRASGNTLEKWFRNLDVQRMNDDEDNEVQPLGDIEEEVKENNEGENIEKDEAKGRQENLDEDNVDGMKFEYVQNNEILQGNEMQVLGAVAKEEDATILPEVNENEESKNNSKDSPPHDGVF